MASISTDSNGNRRILFVAKDGRRKTIRLGKLPKRAAEAVKVKLEHLVSAAITGHAVDDETSRWLTGLEQPFHDKLSAVGLVAKRESAKLGPFLTAWIDSRKSNYKPASVIVWGQVVEALKREFGENCLLTTITPEKAEAFRQTLIDSQLRPTTIHKRLQNARMFFRHAKRQGLVSTNPFEFVRHRAGDASERRAYVPAGTVLRVIERAPDTTWKLLIVLSRFAGLRTPSESLSLRWQDIDWEDNRITVTSPKTEHLPGKAFRVIPLFPEVKPFLEAAWDAAPDGAEFVFPDSYRRRAQGPGGWANANLRTMLEKIIRRAGVESWPRLWHSMRASCETDLARRFPLAIVAKWLGHTQTVAMSNYIDVHDGDMERAASSPIPDGIEAAHKAAQQTPALMFSSSQVEPSAHKKTLVLRGIATNCNTMRTREVEDNGLELPQKTPGKVESIERGDAQSGAPAANGDVTTSTTDPQQAAELRLLELAWEHLPADARRRIMAIVESCNRKPQAD